MNRIGDSGVHTLGDTSAFVNPTGQLLLTRRGKTSMGGVGIVFEFYIAPLLVNCGLFEKSMKLLASLVNTILVNSDVDGSQI